ncbi:MAG: hypothetical protein EHM72_18225, partial [Calditrichaeota bacterium]
SATTAILLGIRSLSAQIPSDCVPGWSGKMLIDCETAQNWSVEHDAPSSGTIKAVDGLIGRAVQLNWDMATGDWVQAKYTFNPIVDLSHQDILGISLRGSPGVGNRVSIMVADVNGVFYGLDNEGINTISRWMINLSFSRKMFYHFFTIGADPQRKEIDWSRIDRFFIVVKRPDATSGGGSGSLAVDQVQVDRAADWPRPDHFETVIGNSGAASQAADYLISQQESSGLLVSWKEESDAKAYLYDQALALIVLSRRGLWYEGKAQNEAAVAADRLADFLISRQKHDGHWARAWDPHTGAQIVDDSWIGDQAWCIIGLKQYALLSGKTAAEDALQQGADWLAGKIQPNDFITASTEGTVDAWWAMMHAGRTDKADLLRQRLLTALWDAELKYWLRGYGEWPDPVIAMDAATWVSEFARSPRVDRADMGLAALGFVRRTLITVDDSGSRCGFDGMGPVSFWCEGTAQYVSAGGEGAQDFLNTLLSLQRPDGSMPGSPDDWSGTGFGWLSSMTGISSTAWLYFALTESPFKLVLPSRVDGNPLRLPDHHLHQNYPNPFNGHTDIRFELSQADQVEIIIFNSRQQNIRTLCSSQFNAGQHQLKWDGNDDHGCAAASGVYFGRMRIGQAFLMQKMTLLR